MIVAGGCTQATYAKCTEALTFDKTKSPYFPKAPTCSDKGITWSDFGWTDFANAEKDIATIRANPEIAIFLDCVCTSVCGEFQDFKDAQITKSGACTVAKTVVDTSYEKVGGNGLCTADTGGKDFIGDVRGMVASKQACMDLCTAKSECIGVTGESFATGGATHCELEARDCEALVVSGCCCYTVLLLLCC